MVVSSVVGMHVVLGRLPSRGQAVELRNRQRAPYQRHQAGEHSDRVGETQRVGALDVPRRQVALEDAVLLVALDACQDDGMAVDQRTETIESARSSSFCVTSRSSYASANSACTCA